MTKPGLFTTPNGKSYAVTFALVSSLFLLWGLCNGMIDTMDKHFQDQLNLSKAQSAWVQFAHYMGYAIMALPAGMLTRRIGYKGGIIFGLMLVSVGGFWFMPATQIAQFWAFLMGVCIIAMGLTVLETVANPYTTVLGPKEYGPTRITLAQSFNGLGWILGPVVGSAYFYSEGGVEKAHGQLFIPYLGVAIIVVILAALFFRAPMPDVQVPDEYHTDDTAPTNENKKSVAVFAMMLLNVAAVGLSLFMILHTILPAILPECGIGGKPDAVEAAVQAKWWLFALAVLASIPFLVKLTKRLTVHSIWCHPHFSGATVAQFVYVAAQAGIFSYFINSMTVDKNNGYCMVPTLSTSLDGGLLEKKGWVEHRVAISPDEIIDFPTLAKRLRNKEDAVAAFIRKGLSEDTAKLIDAPATNLDSADFQARFLKELNEITRKELTAKFVQDDTQDDIPGVASLAAKLTSKADPVSAFLSTNLAKKTQEILDTFSRNPSSVDKKKLGRAMVEVLNKAEGDPDLYEAGRFAKVELRDEVRNLLQLDKKRREECLGRMNRLLLEDAYPQDLAPIRVLYDPARFKDVNLSEPTNKLLAGMPTKDNARMRLNRSLLRDAFPQLIRYDDSRFAISDKGAGYLSSVAFAFFLLGRLAGAMIMKKKQANKTLGLFALANVAVCALIIAKFGWLSVGCVFLSYFFMSIMFPTNFALGIFGIGSQSKKKASAFIVMSITGGALMPKLMGHLGDVYNMSVSFWMPLACFALISLYAFSWNKLSGSQGVIVDTSKGH